MELVNFTKPEDPNVVFYDKLKRYTVYNEKGWRIVDLSAETPELLESDIRQLITNVHEAGMESARSQIRASLGISNENDYTINGVFVSERTIVAFRKAYPEVKSALSSSNAYEHSIKFKNLNVFNFQTLDIGKSPLSREEKPLEEKCISLRHVPTTETLADLEVRADRLIRGMASTQDLLLIREQSINEWSLLPIDIEDNPVELQGTGVDFSWYISLTLAVDKGGMLDDK